MFTSSSCDRLALLAALLLIITLGACGDSSGPSSNPAADELLGGDALLRIVLIDAPSKCQTIETLHITFASVLVHPGREDIDEGEGDDNDDGDDPDKPDGVWFEVLDGNLPEADRTFDLLELVNGTDVILGEATLAPGDYSQIRIIIERATVTIDGEAHDVNIPSGTQTGIKITGGFTLLADETTNIALDFDVDRSLHETPPGSNEFKLRPVIRVVETAGAD